jgi:hypothetical protein
MKKLIALGLIAASLGGCDKLPFFGAPASPHRKLGLWEQTVQSDQSPTPMVSKACFDEASDQRSPVLPHGPRRAGACQKYSVSKDGDSFVVDSDCSFGGAGGPRVTIHAVISGDYSARYTINSTVNTQNMPDPSRNGEHKRTLTAVYQGACPPEIQPGQVQLPNGEIVDMAQLRGGFGGGRGGGSVGGGAAGGAPGGNATGGGGQSGGGPAGAGAGGGGGGGGQ